MKDKHLKFLMEVTETLINQIIINRQLDMVGEELFLCTKHQGLTEDELDDKEIYKIAVDFHNYYMENLK